jgi:hypothetical protein
MKAKQQHQFVLLNSNFNLKFQYYRAYSDFLLNIVAIILTLGVGQESGGIW